MKIITADQSINDNFDPADHPGHPREKAIFLAGPTPRKDSVPSWRPEALRILEQIGYKGTVFIPERSDWKTQKNYEDQTEWEFQGLSESSAIIFWVPRQLPDMMALTTNVEFGFWLARNPNKILYGRPEKAVSCRYLDWMYQRQTGRIYATTLEQTLHNAINTL